MRRGPACVGRHRVVPERHGETVARVVGPVLHDHRPLHHRTDALADAARRRRLLVPDGERARRAGRHRWAPTLSVRNTGNEDARGSRANRRRASDSANRSGSARTRGPRRQRRSGSPWRAASRRAGRRRPAQLSGWRRPGLALPSAPPAGATKAKARTAGRGSGAAESITGCPRTQPGGTVLGCRSTARLRRPRAWRQPRARSPGADPGAWFFAASSGTASLPGAAWRPGGIPQTEGRKRCVKRTGPSRPYCW